MADIMNTNWDSQFIRETISSIDPVNEGAIKGAATAGAILGVGTGIYSGIKQHRLDKIDREEKAAKWQNLKNSLSSKHRQKAREKERIEQAKRDAEYAKYRKMERDYNRGKDPEVDDKSLVSRIKKKIGLNDNVSDATVDEGVAGAAGLGLVGYGSYKAAKGITKAITKKIADDAEMADYEHQRAFGESPKASARRLRNRIHHESATPSAGVLSKVW